MPPRRWDLFCKVVDNYGDAGVCWRLARQLVAEHALAVTLWLDDVAPLARMAPGVDPDADMQLATGVTIRRWTAAFEVDARPGDVVVEAFGCGLPDRYVDAMAQCTPAPTWIVLEYLSAERWVDATHALASPHPRLPLARRYWFPGFTGATGGLLRERGLLDARDAFRRDAAAQAAFLARIGVPAPEPGELRISLFCYPAAPLAPLLDAWADGDAPVTCLLPQGVATGALDAWAGGRVPPPGEALVRGRLRVHAVPFVAQDAYDRLLWSCAVNFVRGEDSFVRAQWAARPLVWHIYAQAEGAHLVKLDAFLDRYAAGLAPAAAAAVRRFWHAWNGDPGAGTLGDAWAGFAAARPDLEPHAAKWAEALTTLPGLAAGLVKATGNGL
ncbi:MAG: elongation factor P maturation arginine rhamnosyltransferase EarP [Betaproteobacteria bacterium]